MSMIIVIALFVAVTAGIIIFGLQKYWQHNKKQDFGDVNTDAKLLLTFDTTDDPKRIHDFLKTALQSRCLLRIMLNNHGTAFNSSILSIEPNSILIDALYPHEGNMLIAEAKIVSLEIIIRRFTSIPFQCISHFMGHESSMGYPALRLSCPPKITRNQKRNYHRVELTTEDNVRISFSVNEKNIYDPAVNISGSGIGFYSNYDPAVLKQGLRIERISIEMKETIHIDCITIVYAVNMLREPVVIQGKKYNFYYGAEFTTISNDIREKIIQYVTDKEREALKESRPML